MGHLIHENDLPEIGSVIEIEEAIFMMNLQVWQFQIKLNTKELSQKKKILYDL